MGEPAEKQALIMIYTGNGKGKTSAAVGQAIRALGAGLKVSFGQFLKRDNKAGEQAILKSMLKDNFLASGIGFLRNREDMPAHREKASELLAWAYEKIRSSCELLVLDESIYALKMELITRDEVMDIIKQCRINNTSLVLTGRQVPDWLSAEADMISELVEVKHHFHKNIKARKGIEY